MSQTEVSPGPTFSEPAPGPVGSPQSEKVAAATEGFPWLRVLILAALFTIPALKIPTAVADLDVWWHLRTGQWVVEHGTVPSHDPFSYYGQTQSWVAYSWLFDVLVYGCYSALDLRGIVLLTLVVVYLVCLCLYRLIARRIHSFLPAVALTALAYLALMVLFFPRPWLFSMLFSLLTLEVVLRIQEGRDDWRIWLLPVVYVLWANVHVQWVYGLLLLALAWVAPLLSLVSKEQCECLPRPYSRGWYRLVWLFLLCLLATFINPYHVRVYGVIWEYATQPLPYSVVSELQAPKFRSPSEWLMLVFFGLAAFALGAKRQWDPFGILLLVGAAGLGFRARRDLWVVVFAASVVICQAWEARNSRLAVNAFRWTRQRLLATSSIAGVLSFFFLYSEGAAHELLLQEIVDAHFPSSAIGVIAQRGAPGPLYNDCNWGGYLIWTLHQKGVDLPVTIDGRTNLHGDDRLRRYFNAWNGRPGWESDPELSQAGIVLLPPNSPLAELLRRDPRFEHVPVVYSPVRLFVARKKSPAKGPSAEKR
jgi:hypothetical protein